MKIIAYLSMAATAIWAVLHFGLPDHPTKATYPGTYSAQFAAVALVALAASIFAALRRSR